MTKVTTDKEPFKLRYKDVGEFSRLRNKSKELHPDKGIVIPCTKRLLRENNSVNSVRYVDSMRQYQTN